MKKNKLINGLLYIIFIISLISYEKNLHKYYTIFQLIIFLLDFITLILLLRDKKYFLKAKVFLKKNKSVIILCILMIISTIFSLVKYYDLSLEVSLIVIMFTINIVLFFFMIPVYISDNKEVEDKLINIVVIFITIISIIGIIIYFKKSFIGYNIDYGRSKSIFFDPNFFAVISAIPLVLLFRKKYNLIINSLIIITSIFGVFASGSRGTMISLIISIIYYFLIKYPNRKFIKKFLIIIILTICSFWIMNYLESIDYFRVSQGSNGRDEMIDYSLEKIHESPFTGFGYGRISKMLKDEGINNASTHNSLIDFLIAYGLPCLFIFFYIILKAFIKSFKDNKKLYLNILIILLFINMNTILYSFGGVGFPSIALTMGLGMACYESEKIDWSKNE